MSTRDPTRCITVPYLDLKYIHAPIMAEMRQALDAVLESGSFASGPAVAQFEEDFARLCHAEHCVGLNSGTSAVHVALLSAGVRAGDEVITTPYTWISTAWAITYINAKPVFVDIDPQTYCIDATKIEAAITPKTKAILPVHLFGHPADMDAISEIARRHNLAVIEDAAQAHGARYKDRLCGSLAPIAAFSFYPGKNLGAVGEGGAVVPSDAAWADRARKLRNHAQDGRDNHRELGFNYRMDSFQGAVLSIKLRHLQAWNESRKSIADMYHERFLEVPDVVAPSQADWASPAWHIYAIQHPRRDEVFSQLQERGVQSIVHYSTCVHLQQPYAHLEYQGGDFPVAESLAARQLSLPIFPGMTEAQVDHVVECIKACEQRIETGTEP